MKLERQYAMLNPAQLKREITRLQNQLYKSNILKQNKDKETVWSKKLKTVSSTFRLESTYRLSSTFLSEATGCNNEKVPQHKLKGLEQSCFPDRTIFATFA